MTRTLLYVSFLLLSITEIACQSAPASSSAAAYTPHMSFDVVSIREKRDGDMSFYDNPNDNSYFHAENLTIQSLILSAYQIKTFQQLEHVPAWATSVRYDLTAKADAATDEALSKLPTEDARAEKRYMMKKVLAERFHLHIHEETRTATVYDLVSTPLTARAMSKVVTDFSKTVGSCSGKYSQQGRDIDSKGCPFKFLLSTIEQQFGTTVTNKTGLMPEDWFAYHLWYDPRPIPRTDIESFPQLRTALHEQLSLDLKEGKGPVTYWIVDSVDRPSSN